MRVVKAIFAVVVLVAACAKAPTAPTDSDAAIRALDDAYIAAWLENDPSAQEKAVLALFAEDATIMPGDGSSPHQGRDKIESFWFPEGASPTEVTSFTHEIAAVDADATVGAVHGSYALSFRYEGANYSQSGAYLMVVRKSGADWKISRMIWNNRS
jgi:uncharacterized protein (TIGR02246 family)